MAAALVWLSFWLSAALAWAAWVETSIRTFRVSGVPYTAPTPVTVISGGLAGAVTEVVWRGTAGGDAAAPGERVRTMAMTRAATPRR